MKQPQIITIDELIRDRDAGRVAELWNVLTDDYFTGEMIPGSRRVPLDQVGREVAQSELPQDTALVVYCSGPGCPHSKAAGDKLASLGFTDVRVFEGGLQAWKEAGRPLDKEPANV